MSANIMYRPTKGAKCLGVGAPSSFLKSMEEVFGEKPFVLNEDSIPQLKAMSSVCSDDNPYKRLVELIEKHDAIEVWAEY